MTPKAKKILVISVGTLLLGTFAFVMYRKFAKTTDSPATNTSTAPATMSVSRGSQGVPATSQPVSQAQAQALLATSVLKYNSATANGLSEAEWNAQRLTQVMAGGPVVGIKKPGAK